MNIYDYHKNKDNSFKIILPFLSSPLHDNFYIAEDFVKSRYQSLTSTIILENGQKVR